MFSDDEEEENGRVLSEKEIAQVVKDRDDIFSIQKETLLGYIDGAFLAIGVMVGIWLSTTQGITVVQGRNQNVFKGRVAALAEERDLSVPSGKLTVFKFPDAKTPRPPAHKTGIDMSAEENPKPGPNKPEMPGAAGRAPTIVIGPPTESVPVGKTPVAETPVAGTISAPVSGPEDENSLVTRGNASKKQDHTQAIENFRRAIALNPRNTQALSGLGDVYLYTGILDSAQSFYTAALAVNPHLPTAHNGLGTVRYYNSNLAANPNYATFRNIHDPARYMKSQYDSAIAEYTNAFALDSTYVEALTNRGVIRDLHNDRDAAIRDYSLAIKINPKYAEAYAKRASTYQLSGKYGKALADYDAAIKLGTGSYEFDSTLHFANAYYGRGIVHYKMGEFEKAVADYDSALALSPRHSLAMLNRGVALSGEKKFDSAIAWLTRAIDELAPSEYGDARGQALMHRGNAFKMLGKFDRAIEDYRGALEYPGLAAKACWRIAECYSLKQDRENTIDWLKKAVSHGYVKFNVWKNDPDLSFVHGDKEFRDLKNEIPPTLPAGRKE